MNHCKLPLLLFAAIALAILNVSCGNQPLLAGGTSETTNGFVAVVHSPGGAPVSHALVRLRPDSYLSDTGRSAVSYDSAGIIDTFTDTSGRFRITNIDTGNYSIEIQDGMGGGTLLRVHAFQNLLLDCGNPVVEPLGSIRGYVNRKIATDGVAVYARVFGMERMALANPSSGSFALYDLPRGDHTVYFVAASPSLGPKAIRAAVASDSVVSLGKVSLFPYSGWAYSRVLGLNTAASGADVAGNVYGFPVLVRLSSPVFTFSQASPMGEDLRFAKSDSTPLPFEIERWDASAGRAEIWVKMDTVRGNDAGQSITMHWGNAGAVNASNGASVFDTADGFQGVWHLSEAGVAKAIDATVNHYSGTPYGMSAASAIAGTVGNARSFDGASSYITMPGTAGGKLNFPENGSYSVSAWAFLDTSDNASHVIVSKGYEQYYLRCTSLRSNSPLWEFVEFNEAAKWQTSTFPAAGKAWTLLTGVRQGNRQFLYCDGVCVDSTIEAWPNLVSRNTSNDLSIGRFLTEVTVPINDGFGFFKGDIDEVRISGVAHTGDWIRLCYMNQRSDDKLVQFK